MSVAHVVRYVQQNAVANMASAQTHQLRIPSLKEGATEYLHNRRSLLYLDIVERKRIAQFFVFAIAGPRRVVFEIDCLAPAYWNELRTAIFDKLRHLRVFRMLRAERAEQIDSVN
jgi:hypothetical protein